MDTYDEVKKEIEERFDDERKRLSRHALLFPIAHGIAEAFSSRHSYSFDERYSTVGYAYDVGTISGLGLHLHLGKDDSVSRGCMDLIIQLERHPQLKLVHEDENADMKYKAWKFNLRHSRGTARLIVRVWVDHTSKCQFVGTGEFTEKMRIICKE